MTCELVFRTAQFDSQGRRHSVFDPDLSMASEAIAFCKTHQFELDNFSPVQDNMCSIGRINDALEKALAKIEVAKNS